MKPCLSTGIFLLWSLLLSAQIPRWDTSHPRLVLNKESFEKIKANVNTYAWAKTMYDDLLAGVDRWVDKQVTIPVRGGNWLHYYVSPKDGSALKPGKEIAPWQWEHISTATGETFKGNQANIRYDFDGCVLYIRHNELSHVLYNLGVAFRLTGNRKYASKAKSILIGYTDVYLKLPIRDKTGGYNLNDSTGAGHVFVKTLDEVAWLITVLQAADMIWDQLTKEEKFYVAERFILPATDVIIAHRMEIHNIQCWKNAAVGLAGFLLNDKRLIEHAMNDPVGGLTRQLKEGATREGIWWERSPSYHFYTVAPIIYLAEAAINNRYPVDMNAVKRLFDGPIAISNAFLTLPAFNDSNPENLRGNADLYNWAYAHFRDEKYLSIIADQVPRSVFALAFRSVKPGTYLPEQKKSMNLPDTKFAILTKGSAERGPWLCFKYDSNTGGWHSQDDKLSFVIYKGNQEIAVDPGVERYGSILHQGWFLSSFAHNTMLVDENQQSRAGGEMIAFGSAKASDYLVSRCNGAYEGVELRRSIALLDTSKVLVIDQFISQDQHTYDVAYHQQGQWEDRAQGNPWTAPNKRGYRFLSDATLRKAVANQTLSTRLASGERISISIHTPPIQRMELISGSGLFRNNTRIPALILRQVGKEALFVWCISLDGTPVTMQSSPIKLKNGAAPNLARACAVTVKDAAGKKWTVYNNPDRLIMQNGTDAAFTID